MAVQSATSIAELESPIGSVFEPWYKDPQYVAGGIMPSMIFQPTLNRYAKAASPNGPLRPTTFMGLLEGFTRSGDVATRVNAAGVFETVGANVPRFTYDPATLQPLGFLVEGSRTNIVSGNAVFPTGFSANGGPTFNGNSVVRGIPVGNISISIATQGYFKVISVSPNTTYTMSFVVQKVSGDNSVHVGSDTPSWGSGGAARARFNTDTGELISADAAVTSTYAKNLGGGLWRFWVTATTTASPGVTTVIVYSSNNAAKTVNVGAISAEVGSIATSIILTPSGMTATRDRDIVSSSDVSWYNGTQRKGTVIVEAYAPQGTSSLDRVFQLDDGTNNNAISITRDGTSLRVVVTSGGVTQADITSAGFTSGALTKVGLVFEDNNVRVVINGGSASSDLSATIPSGITNARLASGVAAGDEFNGIISRAWYYADTVTTSEIQRLTAL